MSRGNGGLTKKQGWVIIGLLLIIIYLGLNHWTFDIGTQDSEQTPMAPETQAIVYAILGVMGFWAVMMLLATKYYEAMMDILERVEHYWRKTLLCPLVNFSMLAWIVLAPRWVELSDIAQRVQGVLVLCVFIATIDNIIAIHRTTKKIVTGSVKP